ncbi:hypothetical protein CHS0354_008086, partial [Potamilus streckersoni]
GNDAADLAAKQGLTITDIHYIAPSVSEIYSIIRSFCNKQWQSNWTNSTNGRFLHHIQPTVIRQS